MIITSFSLPNLTSGQLNLKKGRYTLSFYKHIDIAYL